MSDELSLTERNDLQYHEQRISCGLGEFFEVGEALWKERQSGTWRAGYHSFEDYIVANYGGTVEQAENAMAMFDQLFGGAA